jgi:hypothetical protein
MRLRLKQLLQRKLLPLLQLLQRKLLPLLQLPQRKLLPLLQLLQKKCPIQQRIHLQQNHQQSKQKVDRISIVRMQRCDHVITPFLFGHAFAEFSDF